MPSFEDRFFAAISPEPNSGCWLWSASCKSTGYGQIRVTHRKKQEAAHRASWLIHRGDIPHGAFVLHSCDVRCCVNPDHLFLGTNRDNMLDMYRKGRKKIPRGSANVQAKITASDAAKIFQSPEGASAIARRYNVSRSLVRQIRERKRWTHVTAEGA